MCFTPNGKFCYIQVVEVGHFWGFKADESSVQSQRKLTAEINTLELKPLFVSPYPNLFCLAPFTESEEMRYYRAKVIYVAGNSVEVRCLISFSCSRFMSEFEHSECLHSYNGTWDHSHIARQNLDQLTWMALLSFLIRWLTSTVPEYDLSHH